jgi:hypothetical protein
VHRDSLSTPHCYYRRVPVPPSKSGNSSPLNDRKKRGNLHHKKNPARGNISSLPLSEENCGAPGEKTLKIPTIGAQEIKTLTQNNSRLHKSQCRMKEQDNGSPSKANSTTKDLNTCIQEEISSNEFQDTIIN